MAVINELNNQKLLQTGLQHKNFGFLSIKNIYSHIDKRREGKDIQEIL